MIIIIVPKEYHNLIRKLKNPFHVTAEDILNSVEKIMKVRNPSIPDMDNKIDEIDNSNDRHLRDKTSNKD